VCLSVYWPGIDSDIDNVILSFKLCQDYLSSNPKEPLMQKNKPVRPFSRGSSRPSLLRRANILDYCGLLHRLASCHLLGPRYHVYSGHYLYPPVILPHSYPRCAIVRWWATIYQFNDFAQRWSFVHITISLKKLIQTCWTGRSLDHEKFCRALLQYRNTPSRKDGLSPAQKLFGHPVQDILPAHHRAFLNILLLQLSSSNMTIWNHLQLSITNLSTHWKTSLSDHMWLSRTLKSRLGTSMA